MAGMLPGVETARRRRLRGSGSSFGDYPSGFGSARFRLTHLTSLSLLQKGNMVNQNQSHDEDDNLRGPAREAKERLDGRLRPHLLNKHVTRGKDEESVGMKKKRFGWGRMGFSWKSLDEEECAICLDGLKKQETTHLPCAHRFHSHCLFPWLESNTHCPCCRATVPSFL